MDKIESINLFLIGLVTTIVFEPKYTIIFIIGFLLGMIVNECLRRCGLLKK